MMQKTLLKLALSSLVLLVVITVAADSLYPLYALFGDASIVHTFIFQTLVVILAGSVAFVLIRTLLGILFVVLTVALLVYLFYTGILSLSWLL
ncbi:MAG: hypothetical protein U5R06_23695 [candidate division KSB1 bacterium]|nr:hypothetical protein [candidate division KSB1 bacterium]